MNKDRTAKLDKIADDYGYELLDALIRHLKRQASIEGKKRDRPLAAAYRAEAEALDTLWGRIESGDRPLL